MVRLLLLLWGCLIACLPASGIQPDTTYVANNPDSLKLGIQWSDVKINTRDSKSIAIRHLKPLIVNENNKTCIIILGSDKGNLSHFTLHAASFAVAGFQVVCFDYRGFGRSEAMWLEEEYLYYDEFVLDLEAVIRWAKKLPIQRLGLVAFSMGTIIAQQYAWNNPVDFLVMNGMIVNPVTAAQNLKSQARLYLVKVPSSGFNFEKNIKSIKAPILIFASPSDPITPYRDIVRYASKRSKSRKIIEYPGLHADAMQKLTHNYFGDRFVDKIAEEIASFR